MAPPPHAAGEKLSVATRGTVVPVLDVLPQLDATDHAIIGLLRESGRLPNADLAARVGLSASQCSRRRQLLEDTGVIRSYHAHLDARMLGYDVTAFVQVTLADHAEATRARFARFISASIEVQSCHAVTGDADYLVRVMTRNLKSLNELVSQLLANGRGTRVHSMIVLDSLKDAVHLG